MLEKHRDFYKDNPVLISYYRTGTHYLLMCIEKYFEQHVLLQKTYFYEDSFKTNDIAIQHFHQPDINVFFPEQVLYLYRDPIDVVFSKIFVLGNNNELVFKAANEYLEHIKKWIEFSPHSVISYEALVKDFFTTFGIVIVHLGGIINIPKMQRVQKEITKKAVYERTAEYKNNIVSIDPLYQSVKCQFVAEYGHKIKYLFSKDRTVKNLFNY